MKLQFILLAAASLFCCLRVRATQDLDFGCVEDIPGFVAWWRGGAAAADGAFPLSAVGGASTVPGRVGQGYWIDGRAGSGFLVADSSPFAVQDFTIGMWVKRSELTRSSLAFPADGVLFAWGTGGYSFTMSEAGQLYMSYVGIVSSTPIGQISDLNWHHVAVVKSGGAIRFYIDGAPVGQTTFSHVYSFEGSVGIGRLGAPFGPLNETYSFLGGIDEVTFFRRPLTDAEIALLTAASARPACAGCMEDIPGLSAWWRGAPASVDGSLPLQLAGAAGFAPGRVGPGYRTDGSSGSGFLVANSSAFAVQDFTIGMWVRRSEINRSSFATPADGALFAWGVGGYTFTMDSVGNLFLGHVGIISSSRYGPIRDLVWHHVAVAKSGTNVRFFVDGEIAGRTTVEHLYAFEGAVGIGRLGTPFGPERETYSFLGDIDEVMFFPRALTDMEITAVATASTRPVCGGINLQLAGPEAPVESGQVVPVELSLSNGRQSALTNSVTRITFPSGYALVGAESASGVFTSEAGGLRWQVPQLPPNGTASATIRVRVGMPSDELSVLAQYLAHPQVTNTASLVGQVRFAVVGPCAIRPAGLVGWWRLEGDGRDEITGTVGTAIGQLRYGPAKVGWGLSSEGAGTAIEVGTRPGLRSQNITVEAWVRRGSTVAASASPAAGVIFGGGTGNYGAGMAADGALYFGLEGGNAALSSGRITDTNWHHVVVGRQNGVVRFHIDGRLDSSVPYDPPASFTTPFGIGGLGVPVNGERKSFLGTIDEVSVYDRALTGEQVAALYRAGRFGKCVDDLVLGLSAPETVMSGGEYEVLVTVRNLDRVAATGASVTGPLPLGSAWVSGSADRGSVGLTNGVATWFLGEVPEGVATSARLRLRATAAGGTITNTAEVIAVTGDSVRRNSQASTITDVEGVCGTGPAGLVAFVSGDAGLFESVGRTPLPNNGLVLFTGGRVRQALAFGGVANSGLPFPDAPDRRLQDFSIETWLRRGSASEVSGVSPLEFGTILGVDDDQGLSLPPNATGGPDFAITRGGGLSLGQVGGARVATPSGLIAGTAWHHVGVTKRGTNVVFYVDGAVAWRTNLEAVFSYGRSWCMGCLWPSGRQAFVGSLDETALYDRVLGDGEMLAVHRLGRGGRCTDDVFVSLVEVPAQALAAGAPFRVVFRVENAGQAAVSPRLTNTFGNFRLLGATNGAGEAVTGSAVGSLVWRMGPLAPGGVATLALTLVADQAAINDVAARLGIDGPDLSSLNDAASVGVETRIPEVSLALPTGVSEGVGNGVFVARLSPVSPRPVTVEYRTIDGTAVGGGDFVATNGVVEFPPGASEVPITVVLIDDMVSEGEESFDVALGAASGAVVVGGRATLRITDNDPPPRITVGAARMMEGDGGRAPMRFPVRLAGLSEGQVSLAYSTANDTARAGSDFVGTNGVVVIPPGGSEAEIQVVVLGDRSVEANEVFRLVLSSPTNGVLTVTNVPGTIINDDAVPGLPTGFVWSGLPTNRVPLGAGFPATLTAVDGYGAPVPDFSATVNLSAYPPGAKPSSVLISELAWSGRATAEFQNVSTNPVDVSAWRVSFYDAGSWPLPRGTFVVPTGTTVGARGLFTVAEGPGGPGTFPAFWTAFQVQWRDSIPRRPAEPIAVMLQDASGRLVDYVGADIAFAGSIAVPASPGTNDWFGGPVQFNRESHMALQRQGNVNTRSTADWVALSLSSVGRPNVGLTLPFADASPAAVIPASVADFTNGVWSGLVHTVQPLGRFSLFADDGNGVTGVSAPILAEVPANLSVTLSADRPVAQSTTPMEFTVTVTNAGPDTRSNVVALVVLDRAVNSAGLISFPGASLPPVQVQPVPGQSGQIQIRWSPGNIAGGERRTLVFRQRGSSLPSGGLPYALSHEVRLQAAVPDADPSDDVARVVVEIAAPCVVRGVPIAAWWTADSPGDGPVTNRSLTSASSALLVGARWTSEGRAGFGWRFAGSPGGVIVEATPAIAWNATNGGTVEGWVRVEPATLDGIVPLVGRSDTNGGWAIWLDGGRITAGAGVPVMRTLQGATPGPFADGRWHHVGVGQQPGGSTALIVDGRTLASGTLPSFAAVETGRPLVFGADVRGGVLHGSMDEWALHSASLGTAGIGGIHAAGASGKCLFHLDLVSPDPFPPTAYLQPYQATLTVSNRGPESVPALMVDVSSQSSRDLTASLSGVPLTPEPTFPPMLVGGLDVLEPGGAAPLAFRLVPTNATQGASLSVSAFTLASTRGRFISSSVALPFSSDSDGDAMPDLWEVRYGFNPLDPSDAAGDADGDGMSNLDEYRAGTDPRNAASNLRITLVGPVGAPRLAFPVGPRRTWILERTEVLGPRAEWTSFAFGATADTEQAQEVDPGPRVVGFFRVRILGQ